MKEQIKAPEKIQLSNKELANLSDAQFKTLVIRMLKEMAEYGCKIEERVKAMKSELKENVQEPTARGRKTNGGTQTNGLEHREEISIQTEQNEEIRIQKYEERLRNLWDNLKYSNIWIIGVPEGEKEEQEIENLFEQITKENFPNLAKEIDFQEVQEALRVPTKLE